MFEVGFTELLVISVLALVVLGPERLPRVAAQLGRWMGRARAMARQFREQLEEEATIESTRRPKHDSYSSSSTPYTASPTSSTPFSPTPATQPPEVMASSPAQEIDSNDTHHADLSESPASNPQPEPEPSVTRDTTHQTHERGI